MRKTRWSSIITGGLLGGLGLMLLWAWTPADFSKPSCQLTQNAAWLSVDWTSQPVVDSAVEQLATDATRRKILYLFPYTTYLKQDGSFNQTYAYAAPFVKAFRKFNSQIRLLAWMGLPLSNARPVGIHGWVDLSKPATRQQIVERVREFVWQDGFDGIQIDAETVPNNDPDFLLLLEETRQAIGPDKILSVAGSHWLPDGLNAFPPVRDLAWTSSYYQGIGQRVDQIATMTYDSYAPHSLIYRLWVREQVKGITHSLSETPADLLVGLSVSQEATASHRPEVENLGDGLAGICAGLPPASAAYGVAVYADWEFSEGDWRVWQEWQD